MLKEKYYYSFLFEDEPIREKDFQIVVKYNDMAVKDGRVLFFEYTKENINPDTIDLMFLDKITHLNIFKIDSFLEYHYCEFDEDKLDWLTHTEKLLKRSIIFMEMENKIRKSPNYEVKFNLPGSNPLKYLSYHKEAYDWVLNKKQELLSTKDFNVTTPVIYKILNKYPSAFTCYLSAIEKIELGKFERNILDDLRLTLELFLKEFLKNNKSLENQINEISTYQKNKGSVNEITNMFQKLFDLYTKYQNNNVKHNDSFQKSDVELVHNFTVLFIEYISNI